MLPTSTLVLRMTPTMPKESPRGFRGTTAKLGFKELEDDFFTIVSAVPARSAAVFTRSRFAGPSVTLSRASAHRSRGIAVIAGNANVATGRLGMEHAAEMRARVAGLVGVSAGELMIGSTGVIGRPYPMDVIQRGLDGLTPSLGSADFEAAAAAMMTGDRRPKSIHTRCGEATLTGIAKGGGIVEHDRSTLMAFFFSDADLSTQELDEIFRLVMGRAFNASSIESDTATSDTAAIFVNGVAGRVKAADFERALNDAAIHLAQEVAAENDDAATCSRDGLALVSSI